jgi:hypothetical protein
MAWGDNYTSNSVYKYADEEARQKAVVKKFIQDTPEYYQCDWNDKQMVDYIELSKKPFTTETINWAYEQVKGYLNPYPNIFKNVPKLIGTSLSKATTDNVMPTDAGVVAKASKEVLAANTMQLLQMIQMGMMKTQVAQKTEAAYAEDKEFLGNLKAQTPYVARSEQGDKAVVDSKEKVAPLQTGRRIKDVDD